jgi:hypothetical protein
VIPLRSLVALCRLGMTTSVEGSGVAVCCSELSNTCSWPSANESDVPGGVGLVFCVGAKRFFDDSAASDSGDEVGVLS